MRADLLPTTAELRGYAEDLRRWAELQSSMVATQNMINLAENLELAAEPVDAMRTVFIAQARVLDAMRRTSEALNGFTGGARKGPHGMNSLCLVDGKKTAKTSMLVPCSGNAVKNAKKAVRVSMTSMNVLYVSFNEDMFGDMVTRRLYLDVFVSAAQRHKQVFICAGSALHHPVVAVVTCKSVRGVGAVRPYAEDTLALLASVRKLIGSSRVPKWLMRL